jgi:hypothetical protein
MDDGIPQMEVEVEVEVEVDQTFPHFASEDDGDQPVPRRWWPAPLAE